MFFTVSVVEAINDLMFWNRVEEEVTVRTTVCKQIREIEGRMQEVQEDLEAEKVARSKAERQKRDLGEVGCHVVSIVEKCWIVNFTISLV